MWRYHASGENWCFLMFASNGQTLPQLNIKAVHNLKTKSLGIILTPRAVFVPISHFYYFWFLRDKKIVLILAFLPILPQLKTFSKNLSVYIFPIPDATFVPNLTFLGLLSPEIKFKEKTVTTQTPTQTDRQIPSLFCHP